MGRKPTRNVEQKPTRLMPHPTSEGESLLVAIKSLEHVLLANAAGWNGRRPQACLSDLDKVREHVEHHIRTAEGPHGLIHEVLAHSPRLDYCVARLRREHEQMRREIHALQAGLKECDDPQSPQYRKLCFEASRLLQTLCQHEALGVDLVLEAFCTDIGHGE